MKRNNGIAASILVSILLTASLASCGDHDRGTTETPADTTDTAAVTDAGAGGVVYEPDDLPEELDFGGITTHIFGWEGSGSNEFYVEEENGDIVNDAIYVRNRTVEERLNLVLTYTLNPGAYNDRAAWVKTISQSVMAGDGSNDIVAGYSMSGATLANNRLLIDLMQLDYIDFEKPWWPDSLIKEATCGGKLYFCSGDISTNMIDYLYAIFFNKSLAENYDIENLYDLVREGGWTLDKMIELCSDLYSDLNGDGKKDPDDQFGYITHSTFSDTFFFASGLRVTEPDPDGLPVLSEEFGGEKTQDLLVKLVDMFQTDGMYLSSDYEVDRRQFLESRALFYTTEVQYARTYFRDTQIEYGILPVPKYDQAQENYYTVSSFPYTLYGIPVDAKDPSMSAAMLECLASESYRTVSPALFEVALKVKYAGDTDVSEMYDIIRGSNVFDIGRIFNDSMGGSTYSLFRSALMGGEKNWISTYEKNVKRMTNQFNKIVENLLEDE